MRDRWGVRVRCQRCYRSFYRQPQLELWQAATHCGACMRLRDKAPPGELTRAERRLDGLERESARFGRANEARTEQMMRFYGAETIRSPLLEDVGHVHVEGPRRRGWR